MLGPHYGERAAGSQMRLKRGKQQLFLELRMGLDHSAQYHGGLLDRGKIGNRAGFDLIEQGVKHRMFAKQDVSQSQGRSSSLQAPTPITSSVIHVAAASTLAPFPNPKPRLGTRIANATLGLRKIYCTDLPMGANLSGRGGRKIGLAR